MTPREDRLTVHTNGHHPPLEDEDPEEDLAAPSDLGAGTPTFSAPTLRPAVPTITPTQAVVGFGIVAAIILYLLGRRRGDGA